MRKTCCESCAADRVRAPLGGLLVIVVTLAAAGSCAARTTATGDMRGNPPPKISFFNEGKHLVIGVDVRAARLTGPSEFLPLQVLVENNGRRALRLLRESFVLERPDGTRLPVSTSEEIRRDYRRALADAHLGTVFIDTISGRFPEPPYHWQPLDFFPLRTESTVPRDAIDLRLADVTFGYIYFRQPNLAPRALKGTYKLFVTFGGSDATYIVDLIPYDLR